MKISDFNHTLELIPAERVSLRSYLHTSSRPFLSFFPHSPHSILAEAKNLSFNATAAFKAYSNIKANVDAAEKEAKAAKQRASEALALVGGRVIQHTRKHMHMPSLHNCVKTYFFNNIPIDFVMSSIPIQCFRKLSQSKAELYVCLNCM